MARSREQSAATFDKTVAHRIVRSLASDATMTEAIATIAIKDAATVTIAVGQAHRHIRSLEIALGVETVKLNSVFLFH
jgi:hypothetical protein